MSASFLKTRLLGRILAVVLLVSLATQPSVAQSSTSWSPEQQSVWETVDAYSTASKNRDLATYLSYFHPDFAGWHTGDDAPTDRTNRTKGLAQYFEHSTPLAYALEPLTIQVHGTTAVVHYKIEQTLKWSNGTKSMGTSFWTDVLIKENNRWLLFSDHGGAVDG